MQWNFTLSRKSNYPGESENINYQHQGQFWWEFKIKFEFSETSFVHSLYSSFLSGQGKGRGFWLTWFWDTTLLFCLSSLSQLAGYGNFEFFTRSEILQFINLHCESLAEGFHYSGLKITCSFVTNGATSRAIFLKKIRSSLSAENIQETAIVFVVLPRYAGRCRCFPTQHRTCGIISATK